MPSINKKKETIKPVVKNIEENVDEKAEEKAKVVSNKTFYIVLGDLNLEINAKMYIDRLRALGLVNLSYDKVFENDEAIYRVYSQHFYTEEDAKKYKTKMIGLGFINAFIKEV